ncbi:MAG: hypothetical protein ACU84H_09320 [Gammaproteobacteria bacterium]
MSSDKGRWNFFKVNSMWNDSCLNLGMHLGESTHALLKAKLTSGNRKSGT